LKLGLIVIDKLKVLCPDCGKVCVPEVMFMDKRNPIDFQGKNRILVDDVVIRLVIDCPKCGRQNIFEERSGPLFFMWVGP